MKNYTLYLIRHGITAANLNGLYAGGGTDLPLCPEGREDLEQLKRQFVYPKVDTVFLSPMARAFHSEMTHISGKNRILRVIESQDEFINRFSAMAIRQEDRRVQAHEEHYKLVEYIEKRDLEHLEKLTRRHIERSKEKCLAALEQQRHRE